LPTEAVAEVGVSPLAPPKMKKKFVFIAIFLLVLLTGFSLYRRLMAARSPAFSVEKVTLGEMQVSTSASGEIKAEKEATLKFQTSGRLAWVGVKKGDRVKKGQAIASLDKRDLEKRFKKEMNDYLNERWDFEQTQDDYEETRGRSLVTDEIQRILDKAQFDLESSVLDVEIADLAVKFATIYSPIEGIVVEISDPYPGVNIVSTTTKFRIVDPETLYFEAKVDESEIARVNEGDKAIIKLDAFPNQDFEGQVNKIDFEATTTASGATAYNVLVSFSGSLENLRLGMNGDVEIVHASIPDALLLPISSLSEKQGKTFVWKVEKEKAKEAEVVIGQINDEAVEVVSGLSEGDLVVTSHISQVKEGMAVKP